jgi:hypothetical protein
LEFGIQNLECVMTTRAARIREPAMRVLAACAAVIAAVAVLHADSSALTGTMNLARSGHQATLLMDGRVVVTGGSDRAGKAIARAGIYDPFAGTWSLAQANIVPRFGHAAALLHDGRVLVVGGTRPLARVNVAGNGRSFAVHVACMTPAV